MEEVISLIHSLLGGLDEVFELRRESAQVDALSEVLQLDLGRISCHVLPELHLGDP